MIFSFFKRTILFSFSFYWFFWQISDSNTIIKRQILIISLTRNLQNLKKIYRNMSYTVFPKNIYKDLKKNDMPRKNTNHKFSEMIQITFLIHLFEFIVKKN